MKMVQWWREKVLTQDREAAGEVSMEEHKVLDADPES